MSFFTRTIEETEWTILKKNDGTPGDIQMRGAVIIPKFSNFDQHATAANTQGPWCPVVAIALPPELAEAMIDLGFNVKAYISADSPEYDKYIKRGYNTKADKYAQPDDDPVIFTECNLNFKSDYPPDVRIRMMLPGMEDAPDTQYVAEDIYRLQTMNLDRVVVRVHGARNGSGKQFALKGYLNRLYATATPNDNDDYSYAFGNRG